METKMYTDNDMEVRIYKVTVTLSRLEDTVKARNWVRGGTIDASDDSDGTSFGYAPQVIETKRVNRTIYEQEVEDLDLQALIVAVNKLLKL